MLAVTLFLSADVCLFAFPYKGQTEQLHDEDSVVCSSRPFRMHTKDEELQVLTGLSMFNLSAFLVTESKHGGTELFQSHNNEVYTIFLIMQTGTRFFCLTLI